MKGSIISILLIIIGMVVVYYFLILAKSAVRNTIQNDMIINPYVGISNNMFENANEFKWQVENNEIDLICSRLTLDIGWRYKVIEDKRVDGRYHLVFKGIHDFNNEGIIVTLAVTRLFTSEKHWNLLKDHFKNDYNIGYEDHVSTRVNGLDYLYIKKQYEDQSEIVGMQKTDMANSFFIIRCFADKEVASEILDIEFEKISTKWK